MTDPDHDLEQGLEPVLLDLDDNPVWIHDCVTELTDGTDEQPAIHVVLSAYRGHCDMGEPHFVEVSHFYDSSLARQLAAGLLNAADALDDASDA